MALRVARVLRAASAVKVGDLTLQLRPFVHDASPVTSLAPLLLRYKYPHSSHFDVSTFCSWRDRVVPGVGGWVGG